MNAQLAKHLRLCNRDDGEDRTEAPAAGCRKDPMALWPDQRLREDRWWSCALPFPAQYLTRITRINQASSTHLCYGGLVALPTVYCILSDWKQGMLLVGSMFLLAVAHTMRTRLERQRLERAQALYRRIFLQISELLGSIGAPPMIGSNNRMLPGANDRLSEVWFVGDSGEDDADAFVRFVQAESDSLRNIAVAIQAIETTTRFLYGGVATSTTMASRRTSNVLPNLRYRVHALLRAKLQNLEHLHSTLTVSHGNSISSEQDLQTDLAEDDVITISLLRAKKKEAAQLLSEMCERVLFTPSTALCLPYQRSLLDQQRLECEGVSAFLQQAIRSSESVSGQEDSSLVEMASSLHLALVSMYQQQTLSDDGDSNSTKARFLLQWQAIARQSRLLSERIDDRIMASTKETAQEDETDQDENRERTPALECGDNNDGSVGTWFSRCVDSMVVETLVYSDVANPPKPRRRPPRQDQPERARKIQPSPFDLVEELQVRLQMMAVPEERLAVGIGEPRMSIGAGVTG